MKRFATCSCPTVLALAMAVAEARRLLLRLSP